MAQASSTKAARDEQRFAGHPRGVRRCEEDGGRGHVLSLADAPQRRSRLELPAEITLVETRGTHSFCFHHAWVDRIDADVTRSEFLGQRAGHGINRGLGGAVNRGVRRSQRTDARADINDTSAGRAKPADRSLRREEQAKNIEIELLPKMLL